MTWIKLDSAGTGNQWLHDTTTLSGVYSADKYGMKIREASSNRPVFMYDYNDFDVTGTTINDDEWTHIAWARYCESNPLTLHVWVNGVQYSDTNVSMSCGADWGGESSGQGGYLRAIGYDSVSYTHLRAHET